MESAAHTAAVPESRRRWFRFTLRTILLITTLVGCGVGWLGVMVRDARQQEVDAKNSVRTIVEIDTMDTAFKAYKERYGSYPPSDFTNLDDGPVLSTATLRHPARRRCHRGPRSITLPPPAHHGQFRGGHLFQIKRQPSRLALMSRPEKHPNAAAATIESAKSSLPTRRTAWPPHWSFRLWPASARSSGSFSAAAADSPQYNALYLHIAKAFPRCNVEAEIAAIKKFGVGSPAQRCAFGCEVSDPNPSASRTKRIQCR